MRISNLKLFLKYALPCAETLVERGQVSPDYVDSAIEAVAGGKEIPPGVEKIFKTALENCEILAKSSKKDSIDEEIIRNYFLFNHDSTVDSRFCAMGDFDPIECRTYPGKVLEIKGKIATVETPLMTFDYRTDFVPDLKVNDFVVVHRDFVIEKISAGLKERLDGGFRKRIPISEPAVKP